MQLSLSNHLTRRQDLFEPIDAKNVRLYVCGPTVHDSAHIGNARPVVVFDVLYRLLRHLYGPDHVTYIRNITDVDDKINARAFELKINITELTAQTTRQFHEDMKALGSLSPSHEPKATDHIDQMRDMIEILIQKGFAYKAEEHVIFNIAKMPEYGRFSRRDLGDMRAGARVNIADFKQNPMDFVLWKPSKDFEPGWASPAGIPTKGRPGWHIECSAMAHHYLGECFDIHGGGMDLVFPHHENEIAQSCCAFSTSRLANYWLHNGFVQIEGRKMSKSEGNFFTVNDLITSDRFGGTLWNGLAVRLALLSAHYRQPLDFTTKMMQQASQMLERWVGALSAHDPHILKQEAPVIPEEILTALCDDLNSPRAIAALHKFASAARQGKEEAAIALAGGLSFLGFDLDMLAQSNAEKQMILEDRPEFKEEIMALINARQRARKHADWKEADRIREALALRGVILKDVKDQKTGQIDTKWELS